MRIIGGRWRGHALTSAPRKGVRPTADPVREALFNILADRIVDRPFVDLCAGTGAVGLEALSRGARPVVLVERNRQALQTIARNLEKLGLDAKGPDLRVIHADAGSWLQAPGLRLQQPPAVVFVDPPYEEKRVVRWLEQLASGELVGDQTLIILEHRSGKLPGLGKLEHIWTRQYGDSSITAASFPDRPDKSE